MIDIAIKYYNVSAHFNISNSAIKTHTYPNTYISKYISK